MMKHWAAQRLETGRAAVGSLLCLLLLLHSSSWGLAERFSWHFIGWLSSSFISFFFLLRLIFRFDFLLSSIYFLIEIFHYFFIFLMIFFFLSIDFSSFFWIFFIEAYFRYFAFIRYVIFWFFFIFYFSDFSEAFILFHLPSLILLSASSLFHFRLRVFDADDFRQKIEAFRFIFF